MATAQDSQLTGSHLECPKCVNEITQPLLLNCQHYFCKPCVDDFKQITESSAAGIKCPICQTFSPNEDLQKMEFIQELFDAVKKAKSSDSFCVSCTKAKPDIRCEDCKGDYCQSCKDTYHDAVPILKNHIWQPLADNTSTVVDCALFCELHPSQVLSLYCVDCEKLICLLCDSHTNHQFVTVFNALKEIKPKLKTYRDEIQTILTSNATCLENVISDAEDIKKNYEDMEVEIDTKYEQLLKQLDDSRKLLKKRLSELRTKQTSSIGNVVAFLEKTIRLQKNAVILSNTVIDSTEGGSMIQFLEKGVLKTIKSTKSDIAQPNQYQKTPIGKFQPHKKIQENLLGVIPVLCSMLIPQDVTLLSNSRLTLERKIPKSFNCLRFVKVDNELWCIKPFTNSIVVFSLDGKNMREMRVKDVSKCRSVANIDKRVLLATSNGLLFTDRTLANHVSVLKHNLSDISLRQNILYCLEYDVPKIHVLTYNSKNAEFKYKEEISFSDTYSGNRYNTIQATSNSIFIGNCQENNILQLDFNGQLIRTHGQIEHYGQFKCMLLSGVDEKDGMLICDCDNHRILTMAADGSCGALSLNDIRYPSCVIVDEGKLYVMEEQGSIQIYTY